MLDGNGDFGRALPPPLDAALRAARAGHHVSFTALRAAVCVYIDELIANGHEGDAIRMHVLGAFQEVGHDGRGVPGAWNADFIDELIALCRDRLK